MQDTRTRIIGAGVLTAALLLSGCAAERALVDVVDVASGTIDGPVEVDVAGDDVSITFREITIAPGAGTGLHCHHDQLVAVVQHGDQPLRRLSAG